MTEHPVIVGGRLIPPPEIMKLGPVETNDNDDNTMTIDGPTTLAHKHLPYTAINHIDEILYYKYNLEHLHHKTWIPIYAPIAYSLNTNVTFPGAFAKEIADAKLADDPADEFPVATDSTQWFMLVNPDAERLYREVTKKLSSSLGYGKAPVVTSQGDIRTIETDLHLLAHQYGKQFSKYIDNFFWFGIKKLLKGYGLEVAYLYLDSLYNLERGSRGLLRVDFGPGNYDVVMGMLANIIEYNPGFCLGNLEQEPQAQLLTLLTAYIATKITEQIESPVKSLAKRAEKELLLPQHAYKLTQYLSSFKVHSPGDVKEISLFGKGRLSPGVAYTRIVLAGLDRGTLVYFFAPDGTALQIGWVPPGLIRSFVAIPGTVMITVSGTTAAFVKAARIEPVEIEEVPGHAVVHAELVPFVSGDGYYYPIRIGPIIVGHYTNTRYQPIIEEALYLPEGAGSTPLPALLGYKVLDIAVLMDLSAFYSYDFYR